MTPQEKAKDLVDKFYRLLFVNISGEEVTKYPKDCIQCALIAVDEILNCAGFIWGNSGGELGVSARDEYRKYWQKVKEEIEKL